MIANSAVRRLIETDRETLIDLLAVAYARGGMSGGLWNVWLDPDVRGLLDEAQRRNGQHLTGGLSLKSWNEEMSKL
jgi:hypothetical protein